MKWVDNSDDRPNRSNDKKDEEDKKKRKPRRVVKVCVETRVSGGALKRFEGKVIHERVYLPNPQAGERGQPYKVEYARLLVDGREVLVPATEIVGWFMM